MKGVQASRRVLEVKGGVRLEVGGRRESEGTGDR